MEKADTPNPARPVPPPPAFGGGGDLTGRKVSAFGEVWTIEGKGYKGGWKIVRFEEKDGGRYKIGSWIPADELPPEHPYQPIILLEAAASSLNSDSG